MTQLEAASPFETTVLTDASADTLDQGLLDRFNSSLAKNTSEPLFHSGSEALHARGLAVSAGPKNRFHPTTAAFLPSSTVRTAQTDHIAFKNNNLEAKFGISCGGTFVT